MFSYFQGQDFLSFTRQNEWDIEQPLSFTLDNGTQVAVWDTGVIVFEPIEAKNHDVILSCGVHGNETGPIELCNKFVSQILTGELILTTRVMFLFGNPASMNIGQRFVEENMNRLFSGAHSKAPGLINRERIRAKKLEQYVARFYNESERADVSRIHYDLHTAIRGSKNEKFAVYPYLGQRDYCKEQLQIMLASGVNTILLSNAPTTTFSYFSSAQFGAHAFTVELGKVRPFGENDMTRFIEIEQTLKAMITGQELGLANYDESDFNLFKVHRAIDKHADDFKFYFADDVVNFTSFPVGFLLASEGEKQYKIEQEGEAIVFPNANVANGNRAVLMVVPTELPN
ncbi:succinylglutamate desuccinylase [Psychrobium sp. 1_MG-2023]|uniref:succinylglutamate desuccinylase n=1 Tax=Psychrobium sp. 1_MG-2023 TaxID=3062624 RepID=UPI000C31FF42|nr:succinylglutamate desuccinylase [Psychrobium sp. 1_MG-2023]MDP2560617.1 succinylglutamate desuccinylase [Psychrobium sp. 1_MG-2023]PKF57602.1 succinylglutamate desuccinylase [Alteromonadales bacterium alter-6D02]